MKCTRMIVSGRVQGVWFRATTRDSARKLGVNGYVRNLPDGTVEIVAQGEESQLEALEKWAWQGPSGASVTAVEATECATEEEFSGFEVRY